MKIAVASDDGKTICGHLGRCAHFIVFEVEGENIKSKGTRDNIFTSHTSESCGHDHSPGESTHSHQGLVDALTDCKVVISKGMGGRIVDDLTSARITPIITAEDNAETAVQAYIKGSLKHFPGDACGCH